MHGQLAVLRHERGARSSIPTLEPPDTMTTSASACSAARIASVIVADQAGEVDDRAVALGERGEHRAVGIGDVKPMRRRAGWEQLVAGDDEPDARADERRAVAEPDGAHHAEDPADAADAGLEHRGARDDVLTATADVLAGETVAMADVFQACQAGPPSTVVRRGSTASLTRRASARRS